jgi:4-diphosphocytidyl-2-C-methyl-D-erythritol kinase
LRSARQPVGDGAGAGWKTNRPADLSRSISLRAFAKINLGLRVLGRRPDGYHEVRTVCQTLALHDRLEVVLLSAGRQIEILCDHPQVPAGPDNLVYQAGSLWRRARQFDGSIRVRLEKRIPVGSGLGGASSDAAVTLLGLERLTGDRLTIDQRWRLAAALGSDVPLFLWGGRVLACGRGEEVYPLPDPGKWQCLVVFPGTGFPTAEAYRCLDCLPGRRLTGTGKTRKSNNFGVRPLLPLEGWGPAENDFERVVFAKWPELARLKRRFIRAGAEVASLTGSGSALFALFDSVSNLDRALKLVPRAWHAYPTRTLSRAEYWKRLVAAGRDQRRRASHRPF